MIDSISQMQKFNPGNLTIDELQEHIQNFEKLFNQVSEQIKKEQDSAKTQELNGLLFEIQNNWNVVRIKLGNLENNEVSFLQLKAYLAKKRIVEKRKISRNMKRKNS